MIAAQGQTFWWDFQLGSYCSTTVIGSLGQFITPGEIASASGVTLTTAQEAEIQSLYDNRNPDDLYTKACRITRLQFVERFTAEETKTIIAVAKTNADVELYLWKMQQAQEVSLLDPSTIVGVHALEASGIIVAGRAAQILRAP